jgi:hypothetical protein
MSNFLNIIAEDSEELLNAGQYGAGALIRVQTSATEGGAYADVSGTGSTPTIALVAGTRTYTGYDANGISTSWYRTRFEDVGGTRLSDWSASFQAGGPAKVCTDGQVKARLGIADVNDDPLINELIVQCTTYVHGYSGRWFLPETGVTYTFDTDGGSVLRIPRGIRSVTSMGVNSSVHQPDTGGSYTTVPAADILLRPKAADLPAGWPPTEVHISRGTLAGTVRYFGRIDNGCTITGNFGFAAVPPDIQSVAIDAVVAAYAVRKMGASGVIGGEDSAATPWNRFFSRGSPQRATLDRYRYFGMG